LFCGVQAARPLDDFTAIARALALPEVYR